MLNLSLNIPTLANLPKPINPDGFLIQMLVNFLKLGKQILGSYSAELQILDFDFGFRNLATAPVAAAWPPRSRLRCRPRTSTPRGRRSGWCTSCRRRWKSSRSWRTCCRRRKCHLLDRPWLKRLEHISRRFESTICNIVGIFFIDKRSLKYRKSLRVSFCVLVN